MSTNPITTRPAETFSAAGATALLIAHVAGVTDATIVTALGVVVGFTPAAITWLVVTVRGNRAATDPAEGGN